MADEANVSALAGYVTKPGPVNLRSGNICSAWARIKQKFEIYLTAISLGTAASKVKWGQLLTEGGDDVLDIYNSLKEKLKSSLITDEGVRIDVDKTQDYESVLEAIDAYVQERKSLTLCREEFNQRNQRMKEPFMTWYTDLANLVQLCEYGAITDSMLRDGLVWGVAVQKD